MKSPKFQFSNVVVVNETHIGVIVKTWHSSKDSYNYDVYIRIANTIVNFQENEIKHYVFSKYLSEEEESFYA